MAFSPGDRTRIITNSQDPKSPPNYFVKKLPAPAAAVKVEAARDPVSDLLKVASDVVSGGMKGTSADQQIADVPPPPPVAVRWTRSQRRLIGTATAIRPAGGLAKHHPRITRSHSGRRGNDRGPDELRRSTSAGHKLFQAAADLPAGGWRAAVGHALLAAGIRPGLGQEAARDCACLSA